MAAFTLVQTKKQNGGGYVNSYTVALTSNVTAGNLLVLSLTAGTVAIVSSITDNQGNTWTLADSKAGLDRQTWLYYVKNAAAGATTLTITFNAGQYEDSIAIVREYSGVDTTSPLDQTVKGSDSDYVISHSTDASAVTAEAYELVVVSTGSGGSSDPTFAAGSGYGNLTTQNGFDLYTYAAMEDKITSTTGAQTGTTTTTGYVRGETVLATFKAAKTTTTKTITGVSNIAAASTQKTITGVSRIKATATQTITGVARLKKTVSQTITGISRLSITTTKTLTGISRIKATTTKTITGVTKIFVAGTTQQTITGLSRIKATTQKTITGVSNIVATTPSAFYTPCASLADWTRTNQNLPNETVAVDTVGGYDGGAAIKITFNQNAANEIDVVKDLLTTPIRYVKFKMKVATGTTGNDVQEHTLAHFWNYTAGTLSDQVQIRLRWNSSGSRFQFLLRDGVNFSSSLLGTHLYSLNTYYQVEFYMTDYSYAVVVDGKVAVEWFGKTNAGRNLNSMAFGKFFSTNLTGSIWLDEVYMQVAATLAAPASSDIGKIQATWESWKKRLLRSDGAVVRPNPQGYTSSYSPWSDVVSEGIGYGLMLAVQMNDQTTFDLIETWQYNNVRRAILGQTTGPNLMGWLYSDTNNAIIDPNWATDADIDRLKALYWAHARWGSTGTINYKSRADALWSDFKQYVFRTDGNIAIQPSDAFQANASNIEINMSYIDAGAYQTILRYNPSDAAFIQKATDGAYAVINGATSNSGILATTTGLPADWVGYNITNASVNVSDNDSTVSAAGYPTSSNTPPHSVGLPPNNRAIKYSYDAFRTVARTYWHYKFFNSTQALAWLSGAISTFFNNEWANFSKIGAEWQHNGATIGDRYQASPMTWMAYFALKAGGATSLAPTTSNIYANPNTQLATYIATLPTGLKKQRLSWVSSIPSAYWSGIDWDPNGDGAIAYVNAAATANKIPCVIIYSIPFRDVGQYSAGGAGSYAAYTTWWNKVMAGIGNKNVIIAYEPDALAQSDQLPGNGNAERIALMKQSILDFKNNCPNGKLYVDASHSQWKTSAQAATLLRSIDVQNSKGFSANVSNFRPDSELVTWAQAILANLSDMPQLRFIYDTSRNGNPVGPEAWLYTNPANRQFGHPPIYGNSTISGCDGQLWLKPPGESDGNNAANVPPAGGLFVAYLYNDNVGDNVSGADNTTPSVFTSSGMAQREPAITLSTPGTVTPTGTNVAQTIYDGKLSPTVLYYSDPVGDYLADNTNTSGPFRGKASYFSDSWNIMSYMTSAGLWTDISTATVAPTQKTITGTSRIKTTVQRTITGLARITAFTTKTITGISRVAVTGTSTQTISGVSRIKKTGVQQTVTGLARLSRAGVTQTLTGVSRITNTTQKTVTGVSRISNAALTTTQKTITGKSTIANTTQKTVTGVSRIQLLTTQTITGVAKISSTPSLPLPPNFTVHVTNLPITITVTS